MTMFYVYYNDTEIKFENLLEAEKFVEENDGILCDATGEPIF